VSTIEIIAAAFGLIAVALNVRQHILCWPTGLVQVALYVVVFWEAKLYSDLVLHLVYVVLQLYGWYHWLHGGANQGPLRTSAIGWRRSAAWMGVALVGTLAWGGLMARYTDAAVPYPDAFILAASLVAQWLMVEKVVESWAFWLIIDVVAVWVYWQKGLYPTVALYAVFLGLATAGWVTWQRALVREQPLSSPAVPS
jgi:nicotinamide mononucleotide transporter